MLRFLDYFGKFLLCWFVLETILYYGSGRFFLELDDVSYLFQVGIYGEAAYLLLMIVVSGLIIVVMGPLLLEGKWAGVPLAVLYWAMGNTINPLWYLFPDQRQGKLDEASSALSTIDVSWSGIVLLGIAGFFYFRRWKPAIEPPTDEFSHPEDVAEEGKDRAHQLHNGSSTGHDSPAH